MRRFLALAIIAVGLCAAGMTMAANDPPASADTPLLKIVWVALNDLKNTMRDPDSFIVEIVIANSKSDLSHALICISFRSKNGFGGYNRGSIMSIDKKLREISDCTYPKPDPDLVEIDFHKLGF